MTRSAALLALIAVLALGALAAPVAAHAQSATIDLGDDSTDPCIVPIMTKNFTRNATHTFGNYKPYEILKNCDARGQWLEFSLVGWQWVTGGNLSAMIAATLILSTWIKYRTAIYPIFIGIIFLPLTYFLFPTEFLTFAMVLAAIAVGIAIWWALVRQTRESD